MEEEKKMMDESQHNELFRRDLHETRLLEEAPFIEINNTKTDIDFDNKSDGFLGMIRRKKWMVVVVAVIQNVESF